MLCTTKTALSLKELILKHSIMLVVWELLYVLSASVDIVKVVQPPEVLLDYGQKIKNKICIVGFLNYVPLKL